MSESPMATVEVRAAAGLATIQDLGRIGWRRFGVPGAGALNPGWLRIANALVGNADSAAAIEFFNAGPTLVALDAPVSLACAGEVALTLTRAGISTPLGAWRSITLHPGDSLRAGAPRAGRIGYLALRGLLVEPVQGSASTYTRAAFGGHHGRALRSGDTLHAAVAEAGATERVLRAPPRAETMPIRAVPGPQVDHFDAATLGAFFGSPWQVSPAADRMGMRLDGPTLRHRPERGAEIVSDAVLPGSVQVPGHGLPIVLLADGGTVGGYPKIATITRCDLPRLACAAIGSTQRFEAVSVAAAEALARDAEAALQRLIASITTLPPDAAIDLDAIYTGNLVSGIIDARD